MNPIPKASDKCKETSSTYQLLEQLAALDSLGRILEQREQAVEIISKETGADFGFWSWGHGRVGENVLPVAIVPYGLSQAKLSCFFRLSMIPESDEWIRKPMLPALRFSKQSSGRRIDFWSDQQWQASGYRQQLVAQVGIDEWLICVRYETETMWSCLSLFKAEGKAPFDRSEQIAVETAMICFRWLRCDSNNCDLSIDLPSLSIRNKEVLHLLLDGRSRKEIASVMDTTLHIVNDCVKQIYSYFGANSATELAAIFLRGK